MSFRIRKKEEAFNEIKELVDKFERNRKTYLGIDYNEANTRLEFIDKFFEAFNWDVRNENGFADKYKDVKVETTNEKERPDYAFGFGGNVSFYVEAKKPSVDIDKDIAPAYQVRSYGFTKKLDASILTDFEEFAIYETHTKPKKNDKASKSRVKYIKYNEYIDEFDFLWSTISYDAVKMGSLDNFVNSDKKLKGTTTIDKDLLNTIEDWRLNLAKNIAMRNNDLSLDNLNIAVQKLVDRILFLRIAEGKEIEQVNQLKVISETKQGVYKKLVECFEKANGKYNAGLFEKYDWINNLAIDDNVLIKIIDGIYYPECPYIWDELPIEILGNVYENFLGSEIEFKNVKDAQHTAVVKEKPEVKKAGGVYYTPQYIVNYIVKETLGKRLEKANIDDADRITICDPACGSGSFLVGAYKYLLNWYFDTYTKSKNAIDNNLKKSEFGFARLEYYGDKKNKKYKLTIEEKKRILVTHIFGVDIDFKATEVAKLSLFLVLLDGEGKKSAWGEQALIQALDYKLLPNMSNNIKSGNSLVGTDFYTSNLFNIANEELQKKINAFDWEKEFSKIFTDGGFDIVIGNPPYVSAPNQVNDEILKAQREYLADSKIYKSLYQKWDLYIPFVEKGMQILKNKGIYSSIIPYPFTNQTYGLKLRQMLISEYNLVNIVDLKGIKVFDNAIVTNCIPFVIKEKFVKNIVVSNINEIKEIKLGIIKTKEELMPDEKTGVWDISLTQTKHKVHRDMHVLGDFCYVSKGMVLNSDEHAKTGKFVKADLISKTKDAKHCKKFIESKDIVKYDVVNLRYLEYNTDRCPGMLSRPTFKELYSVNKLMLNRLGNLQAIYDDDQCLTSDAMYVAVLWNDLIGVENKSLSSSIKKHCKLSRKEMEILSQKLSLKYLLSIINSKYGSTLIENQRAGDYHIYPEHIRNIPIPLADSNDQQFLSNLVDKIMVATKNLYNAKNEQEKKVAKDIVKALDDKINNKVYELYGLTDDEIAEIEK